MVKERPIIFSAPMVRAIIDGRKTQTRRVIENPEYYACLTGDCPHWEKALCAEALRHECPKGKPGDHLWVREAWYCDDYRLQRGPYKEVDGAKDLLYFKATETVNYFDEKPKWKPSIHMPRWASRIGLRIKDIRAESLQDISEADARAEGMDTIPARGGMRVGYTFDKTNQDAGIFDDPSTAFFELWNNIHGPGLPESWDSNPWVWVIEFERMKP